MRHSALLILVSLGVLAPSHLHAAPVVAGGLVSVLKAVVANHPAISGKQAMVNAKGFAVDSARAGRYPNFSAQLSYSDRASRFSTVSDPLNFVEDEDESLGVARLEQPLWAFGKISRGITKAKADEEVEKNDLILLKNQLLKDAAITYARIEGLRQKVDTEKANVERLEHLYQKIERRFAGQLVSDADLRLVNTRVLQAKAKLLRAKGDLAIGLTTLSALTQVNIASDLQINRQALMLVGQSLDKLTAEILDKNTALKHKESQLVLAKKDMSLSKVTETPTLSLRIDHNFLDAADVASNETRYLLVLEGTTTGLGFASRANTNAASARIVSAERSLEASRNDVRRDVATIHQNIQLQKALYQAQKQSVDDLEEITESYFRQYEAGRKSWLDVLNMNRELNFLLLQLIESDNSVLILTLELMALGDGLLNLAGGMANDK